MKTFVFGHRNPDTDSVASAISLSYLKNKMGLNTAPRVLGHINKESAFALKYFRLKEPEFLNSAKVQLRNVHYKKGVMCDEYASIKDVINYMGEVSVTAVPIVNEQKKVKGLLTLKEIAMMFVEQSKDHLQTNYNHIVDALQGKEILRFQEEFDGRLIAGSYQSQTFIEQSKLNSNEILIVGDRYKVIKHGIMSNIALIVITNNFPLDEELLELAREHKVSVISSSFDTYNTCNAIALSNYVKTILVNLYPTVVNELDYLTDFVADTHKLGFTNYPIVNSKGVCLGLIRPIDTGNYDKMNVILVDHNNFDQSVPGIEEANIVEIIDHHNLGAIGTTRPINFRCMPLGCTCTILYLLYLENDIEIPRDIAGIMLSAILSDTLILKSPTTTGNDKMAVLELSRIAGVNYEEYGLEMLKAGSSIEGLTIEDIIYQDYKNYKVGSSSLGISQIITMDFDVIKDSMNDIVNELNSISRRDDSVVTLFVTDVVKNGSYVIYNESSVEVIKDSFNIDDIEEGTFLDGFVSRKKQILPAIMEAIERNR